MVLNGYSRDTTPITVGYPTIARSTLPPNGKTPEEFAGVLNGFRGDFTYMNKCSNEVFGYGFNDDGSLTSGDYNYVTATFDVTNTGSETLQLSPRLAEFGVLDTNGNLSMTSTSYDLDYSTSNNALQSDPQQIGIAAGDTVEVTIMRVLPNHLIENENLVFVLPSFEGDTGTFTQAFSVGGQI